MDLNKLKQDAINQEAEKGGEEPDKRKNRLGNFNSGQVNASTTPAEGSELQVGPPADHSGQHSGRTGTTPVMDSGKTDVREPETPRREEEIREPSPEEQQDASAQRKESRREAAIEENPPSDEAENAA